ncbi:BREX system P-loop protein BrxC [endosymbiont of Lamellibrachia barhami]|uniref:BREX system P-loop protein BrxC n=1 Tax=endosymbiont of Lamellibrachia barhami TaxID=205975 RepID=UPI0015ABA6EE|nr:BREX system P-loop protein BrxC [endosymbiont of Lamellibrachia barhami]
MHIKELFIKAIDRPINGVIKADQSDDESVWQELDEYVVTKELDIHLRKFIGSYLDSLDNHNDPSISGKVGVWVSGFFGSGKSHFIKILSYLLENREVENRDQRKQAIDFFDGKIQDAMLAGDIKRATNSDCDVILFNIDSKADSADEHAILRVFLKVLNEKLGYSGDHPHIAHMERYLDSQGKLEAFKTSFHEAAGVDWENERDAYHFRQDEVVKALSSTLGQSKSAAEKWFDKSEQDFHLSVENLAKWVKEYLDNRGPNHRLVFLVDEVGQFIGQNTRLMLNLQTIVENLGTACQGRAWVVVTSQEDIDAVIGEVRASKANDFSKIQGRFKTRLTLSSANVDEVIQKRLLGKTDDAQAQLINLYKDKADILKNQLSFSNTGMSFKAYADGTDFLNVYPFAPYQFQLVQKIFEAIRKHGVTGLHLARGERSMLDAFQSAAVQVSNEELGVLVPLHRFYPSIESFLEGIVKSTIEQATSNSKLEPFDILVLKTLFLIRYVEEIQGNVDNLVTLFIDRIDADRLGLKQQIEAGLQRLEGQTLINRNGDNFFFLTNEERDISREIKDVDLNGPEEAKFLGELVFDEVLGGLRKHRFPDNNKDFELNRSCDAHPHGNRHEGGLTVSVLTPMADEYTECNEAQCILKSSTENGQVIIKLDDDKTLGRELRTYLQTDKYVARKKDGTASTTTIKILNERLEENRERRQRLVSLLERLLKEGSFYAAGQSVQPKSSSGKAALDEAVSYLVRNTFNKLGYLKHLSSNIQAEIKAVLSATDVDDLRFDLEASQSNEQALNEVLTIVTLLAAHNRQIILHELVEERFGRIPFGWPDWEVILLIVRLVMKGDVSLAMDGAILSSNKIFEALSTPAKWRRITVTKRKSVDTGLLQKARKLAKDAFGKIAPDGEDPLALFLKENLNGWQKNLGNYQALTETGNYPGSSEIADGLGILNKLLAENTSFELITTTLERQKDLLNLSEEIHDLDNFYATQRTTWDKLRTAQSRFQLNRKWLERDTQTAAALQQMETILGSATPYGLIKDAESLIQTVEEANSKVVSERIAHALERIDTHVAKVNDELNAVKAASDLRNAALYPLQQPRSQVVAQDSIAHIFQAQEEASDLADDAIVKIDQAIKKQVADTPNKPKPYVKKIRVVKPSQLSAKSYLETQEEIDAFLKDLRETLEKAINADERVEIR